MLYGLYTLLLQHKGNQTWWTRNRSKS